MSEFDTDPIRGLPETPPRGERILWQGAPCWRTLGLRLFHMRKVAIYFAILMVWRGASAVTDGGGVREASLSVLPLVAVLLVAMAVLSVLAWLTARTTVYTITSRRLAIRFGIALPMTINMPFRVIDSAGLKAFGDGAGDISLTVNNSERLSYLILWPHVRPWRLGRPEPTLRGVSEAATVAKILADALAEAPGGSAQPVDDRGTESLSPSGAPAELVTAA